MNTEENQNINPAHPLFSFQDDPYLSLILNRLNSLINPENLDAPIQDIDFQEIMRNIVFQDQDLNQLQQASFFSTTLCSKSINKGDICFVCLECNTFSHPNIYAVVCVDCFDKSHHKGHRFLRIIQEEDDRAANCDCGDTQFLQPEGFCSDHQSKPINMQELYQNFPQDLRADFQMIIKKSIYAVVSLFEIKQQYIGSIETFDSISILAENLLRDMLHFAIECYSEVNRAFLPILWNALRDQFDSPYDLVGHDCQDLEAAASLTKTTQEPHKCTCSPVGNLFKISNLISRENQEKFMSILVECVKDQDFLGYLSVEFVKHIKFFFIENNVQDQTSLLVDLYSQLFLYDSVLLKILDSGYFKNLLEMMKEIVESSMVVNQRVFKVIDQLASILDYFLIPGHNSAQRVVKDQSFMSQYLDIIMTYQMKFFYTERLTIHKFDHEINYDAINAILRAERRLGRSFENYTKLIYYLPDPEKKQILDRVLQNWEMSLQNAKAALQDDDGKPLQSFNPCLERIFCCINLGFLKDTENKGGSLVSGETALSTLEGPIRALGMKRYLHLTYNYKYGKIFNVYYYVWNSFFETDVVTTQMMLTSLKPIQGVFELLIKNFFSYSPEIQQFFSDPNEENYEKKLLTAIEDFLYFLVFLMTDEICMISVETKYKKDQCTDIKYNPRQRLIVKNLLINILRGFYWTTSKQVKEVFERFLIAEQEVDEIISQITIKDEKQHKIRIKDEYESAIDPYILYRLPAFRQEIMLNFTTKSSQKIDSIDLISGSSSFLEKDVPQYLKDLQVRLYQSNLPEFLCNYLKMANLKTGSALIRLVLKLILMNLQVAEEYSLLRQKIEENYINDNFLNILQRISTDEGFKDCKNCIESIKRFLQKFQKTHMLVEDSPRIQKEEGVIAKKKLTAQERMAQLKQNFTQKQAAFAQSNQYLLQKSMSFEDTEESKKEKHLTCQYCMEKLHASGEEYGLPIYVTFTNNFYDTADHNFVEQDYQNLLKADWWPVISSCHHHYHRKCFETLYKAPKGLEGNFLSSRYETFCPLCKGLCNNFLSINRGEAVHNDDMNQEVPLDQQEIYPQIYQTFTKKIQKILLNLKTNISPVGHATALEEAAFVPIETIFERAYQYFIESFYLLETSQNLEKSFELYLAFFKGFKAYFKNPELKIPEDNLQLSAFFNVNNLFLSTQALSPPKELNYKPEVYLIELLAKNLQRILAGSSDTSGKSELLALKNFILFKVVQTIAYNNSDSPQDLKLEDCFQLYQSNQDLRRMVLEQITFPIQKIILSYGLNISTAPSFPHLNLSELFNLLLVVQNPISLQEEYLTDLLRSVNIPFSFPEFILEIFQELPTRPQSEINFLSSLFDHQLFNKETLKPQLVKFSPRMIQLPENYLEFNTHYFSQKCNLCKKFSPHLYTSICLICGEVLCTAYCNKNSSQAGNLNRHAKKYHMGMGLFLDVQRLKQNLTNSPMNNTCTKTSLYLDSLGQDIIPLLENPFPSKIAKFDFTQYKLNQELLKELHDIVYQQNIRKEIFSVGIRNNRKVTDNFL